ncbi:hypothetical protein [Algoriphagus boritolerans]|uniref:Uncharacterized protein n=1 Tax=Algoriphagus boritolerans DSM 17298 = JCM 18970 TaxID=1120964 RepID=A0A1H5UVC1_9BACT|nr:hypothetical protein [Algoriphagus boritolerans]SEF79009.1 hypothetical protein SAMN03080598_01422 [Algoriphagus boritolerans DSM 17298 = JCM 18970]
MKKIEIQVDQASLELYNKLDSAEKQRFEESVLHLLASFNREEIDRYQKFRNQMAKEATINGLTEDELNRILKLED